MKLPNKDDVLFLGTFGNEGVATINWTVGLNNDTPFHFLMEGYKIAFLELIKNLTEQSKEDLIIMDFKAYPILFCLRHYIELSLKDTIRKYKMGLKKSAPDEVGFNTTHEIEPLFHEMKKFLLTIPPQYTGEIMSNDFHENLTATENLIKELTYYDKQSFAFRYPYEKRKENQKIELLLPQLSVDINNLFVIGEKIIFILSCINMEAETFCFEEQLKNK